MTYGRCQPLRVVFLLLLLALAARPAPARPAPASEMTVTLLSVGPGVLQAQGADGRALTIKITPATWVLQRGLVVSPREMTPGETLRVRLGRGQAGSTVALLVCDLETAEAIEAQRRRPLTGTVASVDGKVWTVQPAEGAVPLPVCLSPRTAFRAGGSPVAASAFGAGAQVTITTRGLANGLLAAVAVSDAASDGPGQAAKPGARTPKGESLSGVVVEARPDLGLLTVQSAAGATRTVAVDAGTRVRSGGRAASLGEMAAGMRVRVRLGAGHHQRVSVGRKADGEEEAAIEARATQG